MKRFQHPIFDTNQALSSPSPQNPHKHSNQKYTNKHPIKDLKNTPNPTQTKPKTTTKPKTKPKTQTPKNPKKQKIFISRILNNKPPYIFEDGNQIRDFVHVKDVAKANILALEHSGADYTAINIGKDKPVTIQQLAKIVMAAANNEVPLEYRPRPKGDPYGGYAETTQMKKLLEWKPKTQLKDGVKRYYHWAKQNKNIIPPWL